MRNRSAKSKPREHLINHGVVARKLGLSLGYVDALFRGERKSVKRLKQIEDLVLAELAAVDRCWRNVKPNRLRNDGKISTHGTDEKTDPERGRNL